jgi:exosortase
VSDAGVSRVRASRPGAADIVAAGAALTLAVILYWPAAAAVAAHWLRGPDIDQGLILFPLAIVLMVRLGLAPDSRPMLLPGIGLIAASVVLRIFAEAALDVTSLRASLFLIICAAIVLFLGTRQLRHWWLPLLLMLITIPLPNQVWTTIAEPLQIGAARVAAAMLATREIPVQLAGIAINLPGRVILVSEGCSGLQSMTTVATLALVLGQLTLRSAWGKAALVLYTIPVSFILNSIRIFITGFLVYFISPAWGEGTAHLALGWVLFMINIMMLIATGRLFNRLEAGMKRSSL